MESQTSQTSVAAMNPWFHSFWRVVAIFWLVMLAVEGRLMLIGEPDAYLHQHLQGVLLELAGLLVALSFLAANRSLRWTLMASASAAAAIDVLVHLFVK